MLTLLATYFMTFAVHSFKSPHFLAVLDANGQHNFRTSCLSKEQHCIAKMEVSVVGMDPSVLTMTFRDVIVSHRDTSTNITYYLQVNRADNTTVMATTNIENASIFQMSTDPLMTMSKVQLVRFKEINSNRTLQAVHQNPDTDCAVGSLEVVANESDSSLFRVYNHFNEEYFIQNPECCL